MIVWINGAFGAGKTLTAGEIHRRLPDSVVYDPEDVGYALRRGAPRSRKKKYPDFRGDPVWRELNFRALTALAASARKVILVPMTLTDPHHYAELIGGLRAEGIDVRHVTLGVSARELRQRLRARLEMPWSWAARHAEECLRALARPPFEGYINTDGMSIPTAAEAVASRTGLVLAPRGEYGDYLKNRWRTQLRAVRR